MTIMVGDEVFIDYTFSDDELKNVFFLNAPVIVRHIECLLIIEKHMNCKFDVSNSSDCEKAVSQIIADFGTITALVNNAGVALYKLATETTDFEFDRVMNVNFKGTFNMTRAVLPHMINQKSGAVVNVSSMWGISGGSMETVYSASKAAIIGFTKAVAKEVGLSGVRVNAVAPGVIMTDMTANLNDHDLQSLKDETPLNALGTPKDVANTISFLLSDDAKFITGQTISVDGGMII